MLVNPRHLLRLTTLIFVLLSGPVIGAFDISSITITSDRAQCVRHKAIKHLYTLTYRNNVHITFSDATTARTDALAVLIDPAASQHRSNSGPKNDKLESIKQITLQNNVEIVSAQHMAKATKASFMLDKQLCVLEGDVHIRQNKQAEKDIPITIDCEKAEINLATEQVKLLGSHNKPVSTTLVLNNTASQKPLLPGVKHHGKNKNSRARAGA